MTSETELVEANTAPVRESVNLTARLREFQGIPATGRTVSYVSHEFYRIANGAVAEEWICSDMASLFRQLS